MDIVIIGPHKTGTTWLFSMLKQQPRVCFAFQKEIHYFDKIDDSNFDFQKYRRFIFRNFKHNLLYKQNKRFRQYIEYCLDPRHAYTDEWYRNIFLKKYRNDRLIKNSVKVKFLDVTPSYMGMTEKGIAHMARVLPSIEPLLVVRDPIRRMISTITMGTLRLQNKITITDEGIINAINERLIPHGNYSNAIPLFRKYFKNLNIIQFGRIPNNPDGVLSEIEMKYHLDKIKYTGIETKRNSQTGLVTLSDNVLKHIASVCECQYDYLRSEFGENFLKQI